MVTSWSLFDYFWHLNWSNIEDKNASFCLVNNSWNLEPFKDPFGANSEVQSAAKNEAEKDKSFLADLAKTKNTNP